MFLNELLSKAYVKEEDIGDGEIMIFPKGSATGVEMNLVVKEEDFEQIMVRYRSKEPMSDPVLKMIGKCSKTNQPATNLLYRMLARNLTMVERYTKLSSEYTFAKIDRSDTPAEQLEGPMVETPVMESPLYEESAKEEPMEAKEATDETAVKTAEEPVVEEPTSEEPVEEKQETPLMGLAVEPMDAPTDDASEEGQKDDEEIQHEDLPDASALFGIAQPMSEPEEKEEISAEEPTVEEEPVTEEEENKQGEPQASALFEGSMPEPMESASTLFDGATPEPLAAAVESPISAEDGLQPPEPMELPDESIDTDAEADEQEEALPDASALFGGTQPMAESLAPAGKPIESVQQEEVTEQTPVNEGQEVKAETPAEEILNNSCKAVCCIIAEKGIKELFGNDEVAVSTFYSELAEKSEDIISYLQSLPFESDIFSDEIAKTVVETAYRNAIAYTAEDNEDAAEALLMPIMKKFYKGDTSNGES